MDSNPFASGGGTRSGGSPVTPDGGAGGPRVAPGPKRLTRILGRLGPTFIKVGQFLALRPDVLPQEYCDELLRLVDRAPTVPWELIHAILTEELGDDPDHVFAYIRRRPLAAGSIAQVHLAKTREGRLVAVKVQRPDLPARVARDMRKIRWLARFIKASGIGPLASPEELSEELGRWLEQELDFTRELRNCTRMYEEMPRHEAVRVPEPFPLLSRRRVLTTEYLPGVPFSELIRLARAGEAGRIEPMGLDVDSLAVGLIESSLQQIFRMRFFHADLHPGNLIAMKGNAIGLVDFGLCDVLDPSVERWQSEYLRSLYNNDVHGMYRALSQIFVAGPRTELEIWRRDFFTETNRWLVRIEDDGRDAAARSPTAGYMVTLLRLARRHDMRLPAPVLSMYRTLLASESVAYQLRSRANLRDVGRGFFDALELERVINGFQPQSVLAWLMQLNELVRSGPGSLQVLLSDIAEGRFILSVRSADSDHDRHLANQRARLVALAILSLGVVLPLALVGGLGRGATWSLLAVALVLYIWMVVIWRRLK